MVCLNCGKEIPDHTEICPKCSTSQSITELEYRTGAKSHAGAAVLRFREEPATRQGAMILELLGILLGFGGILFAVLYPDAALIVGHRALLCVLSSAIMLGFGVALCVTLSKCHKAEV